MKQGILLTPPPSKEGVGLGNVKNVDTTNAANITTGVLPDSVLPPKAVKRLVDVANQAARYALTVETVQQGDTVRQLDTQTMYLVIDDTKLSEAAGYAVYRADMPFAAISGKPTTLAGYGITDAGMNNEEKMITSMGGMI